MEKNRREIYTDPSMNKKIPRSVGTHDGSFHADEVTACALLVVFDLVDPQNIVRSREPKHLAPCEYVCDVGGRYDPSLKLFDHHQLDYQGTLSSAGMVLQFLRDTKKVDQELFEVLRDGLIDGVDAHDNGRSVQISGLCTFSHVIANFSPVEYDAASDDFQKGFAEAFAFARGHLERLLARHLYTVSCRAIVSEAMKGDPKVLIFEKRIPWLENFFALGGEKHPAQFVVMPSGDHWKLRGIPPTLSDRMAVRWPMPAKWAGLLDEELAQVCRIEEAIFCHKGRFISVWATKKAAMQAAVEVIRLGNTI